MSGYNAKFEIRTEEHKHTNDSEALNSLTQRLAFDNSFLNTALGLLDGLEFPAYRQQIIDHIAMASADSDCIRLYETLDFYIRYDCIEQIQAAFEVNLPLGKHNAVAGRRNELKVEKTTPAT